jgi:uncharacterized protein (DUF927 family)
MTNLATEHIIGLYTVLAAVITGIFGVLAVIIGIKFSASNGKNK